MDIGRKSGAYGKNAVDDPSSQDGVDRTSGVEKALSRADRKLIGPTCGEGLSDIHIGYRVRCSQVVGVQHNARSGLIDGRGPISIRLQVLLPGIVCEELQAVRHLRSEEHGDRGSA